MTGLTRRDFLKTSSGGAVALTIGFSLHGCGGAPDDPLAPDPSVEGEVNAWLVITPDDQVTIRVAKAEMGQGVLTALAMIVAEELDCRWQDVRTEAADVNRSLRAGGLYGSFLTDGSSTVRGSRKRLQRVGANARLRLVRAAAQRWDIDPARCQASQGRVTGPDNQSLRYGELVAAASRVSIASDEITIRSATDYRLLGRPRRRLDVPSKVTAGATFGIDVRLPGMRYAAVRHCPVLGGRVAAVDESSVADHAGVHAVLSLETAVAVVADSYYRADKAVRALSVTWDEGPLAGVDSAALRQRFVAAAAEAAEPAVSRGDAPRVLSGAERLVEAIYDVPYLAHACMEPMNCTAAVTPDRVDVWVGTQDAAAVLEAAREITGRQADRIHVHQQLLGGGFGRRISTDHVRQAVQIATRTDGPVQLIWTREDDLRQGYYRPMAAIGMQGALTGDGRLAALRARAVTDSIFARHRPADLVDGFDPTSLMGLRDNPYALEHLRIESRRLETGVPTWLWRSVGASQNTFALESFLDELAVAAGTGPLALRRGLLAARPDILGVLSRLEELADPDAPLGPGRGRGMAMTEYAGTTVAQCIDVSVTEAGALAVDRVVCVVDCGHVVNPLTVEEQIEGAVVFGLSAALSGSITIENGRIREGNFDRYRILGMAGCPPIETHLALSGNDKWGGVGEPGLPPVAPALVNAIYRATGRRIRSLPVSGHDLRNLDA